MKSCGSSAPPVTAELKSALLNVALKFGVGVNRRGRESDWTFDCREVLLSSTSLTSAARELWPLIRRFGPTAVGGETLGADPLVGALLLQAAAEEEYIKGFIVRKSAKPYGTRRRVEGPPLTQDDRIVVIDDLINTATTYKRVAGALEDTGAEIVAVATVVNMQRAGSWVLQDLNIPLVSLVTATDLGLGVQLPNRTAAGRMCWMAELPTGAPRRLLGGAEDGSVIALSPGGDLACLDESGEVRWERRALATRAASDVRLALAGQTIVATDGESLSALDLTSGELACGRPCAGAWVVGARAGIGDRGVAVCAGPEREDGVTHIDGIDLATGETRWSATICCQPAELPGIVASRAEEIVIGCTGTVRAISMRTGKQVWRANLSEQTEIGPVVCSDRTYASCMGDVVALASDTGQALWRRRLARRLQWDPTVTPRLLIVAVHRRVVALDQATGRIEWLYNVGEHLVGSAIYSGGVVVACSGMRAHLLDPATGRLQATVPFPAAAISGPVAVPGGYVIACERGVCRYALWRET